MATKLIEGQVRDLGGFSLRRVLPAPDYRAVGPFVFFDHFGPQTFGPGQNLDVRPHPHIGLATVTYLLQGNIDHRDSLGFHQTITPGAINWMTAGKGIVHSERTPTELRKREKRIHGIQLWVALPEENEEDEPAFFRHPQDSIPIVARKGVTLRVLVGSAFGAESPVEIYSPMFYVDASLESGATLQLEKAYSERALFLLTGSVSVGEQVLAEPRMLVFEKDGDLVIRTDLGARFVLLGGEPLGPRTLFWNFVSSNPERIAQAKRDWTERKFPLIPGDEEERAAIPGE
ncbi:pirin family protein [Candidatus Thiosymbion oneisti]|uniref:pirin family protein n=1 Tax=Candidatus Thiosymbion oneisti TaxID=589554 RepID=UPI000A50AC3C|nr:pirin family protein [Candidatus Thiosymbion oneisti]